ncbi:MAG: hypothetical protein AABZ30_01960 [Myxococcota bacterium]
MLRPKNFVAVLALALAGCPEHPLELVRPDARQATPVNIPLSVERDLDILFLIDDSNSMGEEQGLLAQQFGKLMFALNDLDGGFPNAHIGVISSNLGAGSFSIPTCQTPNGDRGCLQVAAGCGLEKGATFIDINNDDRVLSGNIPDVSAPTEDSAGNRCCPGDSVCPKASRAPDGQLDVCDVASAFACTGQLGINGCGFEHQWEAVKRAVDNIDTDGDGPSDTTLENGCNGGFLRDSALLAVMLITDEDDCSAANGQIFTPDTSMFGPLQSFRCFEFGMTCDQPIQRAGGQTLSGCRPLEGSAEEESPWFYPPSRYINFFQNLKAPGQLLVGAISAPFDPDNSVVLTQLDGQNNPTLVPSCGTGQTASPAIRIRAVVDGLGKDGIFAPDSPINADICSPDYSPALRELRNRIAGRLMPGCIPSVLTDADGDMIRGSGDAQCTIEEVQNLGAASEERQLLDACQFVEARETEVCPTDPKNNQPLSPGAVKEFPCYFFCDSTGLENACPFTWQLRVCRDEVCNPATTPPPNTRALATCTTCSPSVPGCLCGDGVCDEDLDETAVSCCEDCDPDACEAEGGE